MFTSARELLRRTCKCLRTPGNFYGGLVNIYERSGTVTEDLYMFTNARELLRRTCKRIRVPGTFTTSSVNFQNGNVIPRNDCATLLGGNCELTSQP